MFRKLSLSLIAVLMLILSACSQFNNRGTVDKPFIGVANTESLSFDKIELSDSATVLHGVIHFRPKWWVRLAKESAIVADGVQYPVTSFDSITPDERVWMPESGVIRFTMTFPPIPSDVRSIDFTENIPDGWALWDIDLTGTATPDKYMADLPASVSRTDSEATLPEVKLAYDTATVRFHVMGYRPEMGNKIGWGYDSAHGQVVSQDDEPAILDSTGVAEVRIATAVPVSLFIYNSPMPLAFGSAYVAPGETVDFYINAHYSGMRNMAVRDEVDGGFGDMVRFRSNGIYPVTGNWSSSQVLQTHTGEFGDYHMNGDEFTEYLLEQYNAVKDSIESDGTLSAATRQLLMNNLKMETALAAVNAKGTLLMNYLYLHNRRPEDFEKEIPVILSDENFRAVAEVADFNDPNILLYREVDCLTNTDFWKKAGVDAGLLDMVKVYDKAYNTANMKGVTDSVELASLRAMSAPLADEVEAVAKAAEARLATLDYSLITPTPDVSADKLLQTIIAPHRGKVVMVDLWNTWCGPCRGAIAQNEPEKSGDLASDDIVWIYIADESSPADQYLKMIKNIRGIHYRVNEDQIAVLRKQFNVDGIPFYILVDRKGKAAGRPDLRDHSAFKKAILDEVAR